MKTTQVYDEVNGKTIDKVLIELKQDTYEATHNHNVRTYSTLTQLGLASTATLDEIAKALPRNSRLTFDFSKTSYPNLDLPPPSGHFEISKGGAQGKAYMTFRRDRIVLSRAYSEVFTPALQPWEGLGGSEPISAAELGNKCKDIPFTGINYYINLSDANKLTDKPAGASGGAIVSKRSFGGGLNFIVTYMQNNTGLKTWVCKTGADGSIDWIPVVI